MGNRSSSRGRQLELSCSNGGAWFVKTKCFQLVEAFCTPPASIQPQPTSTALLGPSTMCFWTTTRRV